MSAKLKALEAEHRAVLVKKLDDIRVAHGAVHENVARQVFAEALLYLVHKSAVSAPKGGPQRSEYADPMRAFKEERR